MININQLSINLIDSINPFQRAYEVLSKNVDKQTLKIIQDTMAEQKFDMTIEQAMMLVTPSGMLIEAKLLQFQKTA